MLAEVTLIAYSYTVIEPPGSTHVSFFFWFYPPPVLRIVVERAI
jgi:hypothetical protein